MERPDPGPTVRVKVCGLTDPSEALACASAGADWIGLNFYPGSRRQVPIPRAREIVSILPEGCSAVGVFVDFSPADVLRVAGEVGLRIVQLHGDEPPDMLPALAGLTIVRAFRLGDVNDVTRMTAYLRKSAALGRPPDAVLIDGYVPGQAGGTGQTVDESLFERLPPLPRLILAGGLSCENVADRVRRLRPWMVDVASGVESSPGRKDLAKVATFIAQARSAL